MISSTIRPWAMVTIMTAIMALSCSGGGQGGSGFEDSPTDRIFMVAPSQELDCGHVQDMEMMAASNSTPSLQDRGVSPWSPKHLAHDMILDYAVKAKNMFTELVDFLVGWVRSAEPLTLIFVAVVVILVSVVMFKR